MPIHHAVLGLLAEGASYGYELKGRFEEAIGPQWGQLNIGHLYQILERLTREGLVTRRSVPQTDRPDKLVYRLTKQGRRELDDWLSTPSIRQSGYRDDFILKLFVGSRMGAEQLRQVARAQRHAYLTELSGLSTLRKLHQDDALVALLIEAAILHTEANLKMAERAEDQAERLATIGTAKPSLEHTQGSEPAARQGSVG
ncbi:MAG: PadR family transcriptional regulator [Actinobacteria bacterium]|nr:MAG: PadR family transcriptional regulator [Actinomycetota bacterium]